MQCAVDAFPGGEDGKAGSISDDIAQRIELPALMTALMLAAVCSRPAIPPNRRRLSWTCALRQARRTGPAATTGSRLTGSGRQFLHSRKRHGEKLAHFAADDRSHGAAIVSHSCHRKMISRAHRIP